MKKITGKEILLFMEAFVLLCLWRTATLLFPLKWYVRWLGNYHGETAQISIEDIRIRKIARAIARAKKILPYHVHCLAEAITANRMLKRRRIPSTLYLGLARKNEQEIIAHAWLRCGTNIVTGKRFIRKFTVVSSFSTDINSSQFFD